MLYISCQPQAVLLGQPRAGKRRESHGSQTSHAELAEALSRSRSASRPGHSSIFHHVPHKNESPPAYDFDASTCCCALR